MCYLRHLSSCIKAQLFLARESLIYFPDAHPSFKESVDTAVQELTSHLSCFDAALLDQEPRHDTSPSRGKASFLVDADPGQDLSAPRLSAKKPVMDLLADAQQGGSGSLDFDVGCFRPNPSGKRPQPQPAPAALAAAAVAAAAYAEQEHQVRQEPLEPLGTFCERADAGRAIGLSSELPEEEEIPPPPLFDTFGDARLSLLPSVAENKDEEENESWVGAEETAPAKQQAPTEAPAEETEPVQEIVPEVSEEEAPRKKPWALAKGWSRMSSKTTMFSIRSSHERTESFGRDVSSCTTVARVPSGRSQGSGSSWPRQVPIRPGSATHLMWDMMRLVVVMGDAVSLPLAVSFSLEDRDYFKFAGVFTTFFWTLELPVPLFTGYYDNMCRLEMDPWTVFKNRMKNVLPLHITLVAADWAVLVSTRWALSQSMPASLSGLPKVLRVVRILRFLRCVRMVELGRMVRSLDSFALPSMVSMFFTILKLLVPVGLLCHYIACFWHFLGTQSLMDSQDEGWALDIQHYDWGHRYLICFHWAFAQFTPAPPPAHSEPHTAVEELFVIFLLFFGFGMFSSIVGSVTTAIGSARQLHMKLNRQRQMVRRYVIENGVSKELGHHILRYMQLQEQKAVNQSVSEIDKDVMNTLSPGLRMELRFEVYSPVVVRFPFFRWLIAERFPMMRAMCQSAMREVVVHHNDELISSGTPVSHMFFLKGTPNGGSWSKGKEVLRYADATGTRHQVLREGSWIGEESLWIAALSTIDPTMKEPWQHLGTAVTIAHHCSCIEVSASEVMNAVKEDDLAVHTLRYYALVFARKTCLRPAITENVQMDLQHMSERTFMPGTRPLTNSATSPFLSWFRRAEGSDGDGSTDSQGFLNRSGQNRPVLMMSRGAGDDTPRVFQSTMTMEKLNSLSLEGSKTLGTPTSGGSSGSTSERLQRNTSGRGADLPAQAGSPPRQSSAEGEARTTADSSTSASSGTSTDDSSGDAAKVPAESPPALPKCFEAQVFV